MMSVDLWVRIVRMDRDGNILEYRILILRRCWRHLLISLNCLKLSEIGNQSTHGQVLIALKIGPLLPPLPYLIRPKILDHQPASLLVPNSLKTVMLPS